MTGKHPSKRSEGTEVHNLLWKMLSTSTYRRAKTAWRAMYMMKNKNNRIKIWIFWGNRWILHCFLGYSNIWLFHWSKSRSPFLIFCKRLANSWFFSMLCASKKSLFFTKNWTSKTANRMKICLISSASNSDLI